MDESTMVNKSWMCPINPKPTLITRVDQVPILKHVFLHAHFLIRFCGEVLKGKGNINLLRIRNLLEVIRKTLMAYSLVDV
jgi:hypothetical protein